MKTMSTDEWNEVVDVLTGLWPKHAAEMTGEQLPMWRDTLGRFPKEWVVSTLKGFYQRSKFFPKLPEVRGECAEIGKRTATGDTGGRIREEDDARERIKAEWREIDDALAVYTDAQLAEHVVRIVAANPHLAYLGAIPSLRNSPGVKAQIVSRLQQNLAPDENTGMAWRRGRNDADRNWIPGGREFDFVELSEDDIAAAVRAISNKRMGGLNPIERAAVAPATAQREDTEVIA